MGQDDWAIVVGIWDYPDLGDLAGPQNDARAFAEWVRSPAGGGVPDDHLRLVLSSDYEAAELASRAEPTPGRVEALFDELDDIAQRNNERMEGLRVGRRLYLYMAGHGCAPLLDESVLLMANATRRRTGYHIPGKPWANWFYRAGYFDEILLFMDCCRESYPQAPLNVPAYIDVTAPDAVDRGRRLFAFGTKWSRLSRERPMADGSVRGVFTVALLEGLQGGAAEPDGRVTAASLAGYLRTAMKSFLSDADRADPQIPKEPDVEWHPMLDDDFVIVTVAPASPPVPVTSSADGAPRARLAVTAGDTATEISVVDGRLHVAAEAAGQLEGTLDPGIYLVTLRAGEATREEYVTLRPGEEVTRAFPRLVFASPAPLADTAFADPRQREAVTAQSRQPRVPAGQGSEIFIVARAGVAQDDAAGHPGQGLALLDARGERIADLGFDAWSDASAGPIAACNVAVDAGIYRLSLSAPGGQRLEQTVVAAPGWQTQLFLLRSADARDAEGVGAALAGAAILMARLDQADRFDPDRPQARLVELARLGLTSRRRVVSAQMREMLRQGVEDPMLGILGGHHLLLEPEPDLALLRTIVDDLRRLAPVAHPDVEALALRLEPGATPPVFEHPPMLRRSWALLLEATVDRPELVPAGSLAAGIAGRIWGDGAWLIWQSEPEASPEVAFGVPVEGLAAEPDELAVALRRQLARPGRGRPLPDIEFAVGPVAETEAAMEPPPGAVERPGDEGARAPVEEATVRRLVATLGVPRARLEEMIAEIH